MRAKPNLIFSAQNLICQRGDQIVLRVKEFCVPHGKTVAVIGPNGAGKSTLLQAAAQLLKPVSGEMQFLGESVQTKKPLTLRRKIALVMQDPLLVNSTVFDNVAMGLRFRQIDRREINNRVDQWLQRLEIAHLSKRRAAQLSGGEAQRVSLARAFVLEPDLLLLDEPFGALDAQTRTSLLETYHTLAAEMSLSAVFVTHDLDEALFVGDQVAVILDGELRQQGTADEIFNAPLDVDVAEYVGVETVLPGIVRDAQNGHVTVEVGNSHLEAVADLKTGQSVFYCLRPEDITLWQPDDLPASSARNCLIGKVTNTWARGPLVKVRLDCGFHVTALVTRQSASEMKLAAGSVIAATFKASAAHLIAHHA